MSELSTVSVVCDVRMAKPDALALLEPLLSASREGTAANPTLRLPSGVLLSLQVPKFGEDLPLTLDLSGALSARELRRVAEGCMADISRHTGWSCSVVAH